MKSSCNGPMRMNEKIQYAHTATTTLKTMATPVSFHKSRATRSTPGENCHGVVLPKMRKDEPWSPPHLCTGGLLPKGAERLGVHDPTLPGV